MNATRLAWTLWALAALLVASTFLFRWAYPVADDPAAAAVVNAAFLILFVASFSTVGALIASRRPRNTIGWIFCASGLLAGLAVFTDDYAQYALVLYPGTLPFARTAAWVQNWVWPLVLCPAALFVLLFPDGRPPSRRWHPVAWIFAAALAGWAVSQALIPGRLVNAGYDATNPFGIEALGSVFWMLGGVSLVLLLVASVASVASVVVRFRRSRGTERNQLKWIAYAAAVMMLVVLAQLTVESVVPVNDALVNALNLALSTTITGVPIAAGIAILRHGLYDIDVLINRTLVYGALTAMLAGIYLGGVVLSQSAFRTFAGGDSQLAVVASTLAIAALFSPLRRAIQAFIDRRFYRQKYDAAKALEEFSRRLRDETDLDALREGSVAVVQETVAPQHVSMWLRAEAGGKPAGK